MICWADFSVHARTPIPICGLCLDDLFVSIMLFDSLNITGIRLEGVAIVVLTSPLFICRHRACMPCIVSRDGPLPTVDSRGGEVLTPHYMKASVSLFLFRKK